MRPSVAASNPELCVGYVQFAAARCASALVPSGADTYIQELRLWAKPFILFDTTLEQGVPVNLTALVPPSSAAVVASIVACQRSVFFNKSRLY